MSDRLLEIIQRIASGDGSEADFAELRTALGNGAVLQLGDSSVNIGSISGGEVQVGDRNYYQCDDEAIKAIAAEILQHIGGMEQTNWGGTNYQTQTGPNSNNFIGGEHYHYPPSEAANKSPIAEQIDFGPYLRSLVKTYEEWWQRYTLTEAIGKTRQAEEDRERDRPVFDFGLMVQTVQKGEESSEDEPEDSEEAESEKEKIERLPVLEGIRKYADEHVLLMGRPGSGKSTALIRLLLEEAALTPGPSPNPGRGELERIPVLVELRYWETSLLERIRKFLGKHDPEMNLDDSTLEELLRQGRFLLLIDGLNELPSEAARRDVARFEKDFAQAPMIFTTRELSLGGELGLTKKLEMQPLTEAQIRQFVGNYLGPERSEALLKQLHNRLRELGQTPLLLAMLCSIFTTDQALPTNLGEVFRQFTQFYERRLKGDVPDPYEHRDDWAKLLQCLAFAMMQGPDPQQRPTEISVAMPQEQAERVLTEFLREREPYPAKVAERCLQDLLKHHLIQTDGEQIEFRHQLIQEYYAAEKLLQLLPELSDGELKRDYLNYLKWTEPVALMLALVDEEAQALRVVKLAMDEVDLMLGARLAGEVRPSFQVKAVGWLDDLDIPILLKVQWWATSQSEAAIPGLLRASEHPNADIRWRAAKVLGTLGKGTAISELTKAIEHTNYRVRRSAVEALSTLGSNAAIPGLIKAIEDPDLQVRWHAVEALGTIGSEVAIPALLKAIEHSDLQVRRSAAEALGKVGSEVAIPALLKAIEDPDTSVRRSAARALGKVGSEVTIPALLKAIEDPDLQVRWYAAEALGKIGSEVTIPALLKAIEDPDISVRRSAVEALGAIGSEAAIPGLLKAIEHPDTSVHRSAVGALGAIGSGVAIPGLLKAIEHTNYHVRWSAVEALGDIGSAAAIPGLLKSIEDPNHFVRLHAVEALGAIGSEVAIPGLLKVIEDPDTSVRRSAVEALGAIGSGAAIPGLLKSIEHTNYRVRWSAVEALGAIGSAAAIPGLLKSIEDPNRFVRLHAVEALGAIGSEVTIPALLKAIEDPDTSVRRSAVEALGAVGSAAAIPGLLKSIEHPDTSVHRSAVGALGAIGSAAAIPGLLKSIEDPNHFVRLHAVEALGAIGSEVTIPALLKAIEDPDTSVRRSAVEALGAIGSEAAIPGLLKSIEHPKTTTRRSAVEALRSIGNPASIANLWQLHNQRPENHLTRAIVDIQNHCQFYNHEIWREAQAMQN